MQHRYLTAYSILKLRDYVIYHCTPKSNDLVCQVSDYLKFIGSEQIQTQVHRVTDAGKLNTYISAARPLIKDLSDMRIKDRVTNFDLILEVSIAEYLLPQRAGQLEANGPRTLDRLICTASIARLYKEYQMKALGDENEVIVVYTGCVRTNVL